MSDQQAHTIASLTPTSEGVIASSVQTSNCLLPTTIFAPSSTHPFSPSLSSSPQAFPSPHCQNTSSFFLFSLCIHVQRSHKKPSSTMSFGRRPVTFQRLSLGFSGVSAAVPPSRQPPHSSLPTSLRRLHCHTALTDVVAKIQPFVPNFFHFFVNSCQQRQRFFCFIVELPDLASVWAK